MNVPRAKIAPLALWLTLIASGLSSAEQPAPETRVAWMDGDGSVVWTSPLPAPAGEPAGVLTAGPWRKPLPDFELPLFGGGRLQLGEMKGTVLVLNTWATWCEPCRLELPWLQKLYEANEDRGLVAIAVNVGERMIRAIPFAEEIGLSMPIGIYTREMTPTLFPESVPSLLVADRSGRVRGRWNGYDPADIPKIETLIDRVLDDREDELTDVAMVGAGLGRLGIRWMRNTPGRVEDVSVIDAEDGTPLILVSHANLLATYDSIGSTVNQWASHRGAAKLRPAPGASALNPRVAAFRPGGKRIVLIDGPGDERAVVDVGAPLFDVAWLPEGWFDHDQALGLATLDGLTAVARDGTVLAKPDGYGATCAVARGQGDDPGLWVLETTGRMRRLGAGFDPVAETEVPAESWSILTTEKGELAVATGDVLAMAHGDFVGDGQAELALATRSGRLIVVTTVDGEVVFDAEWPDLGGLAAVDIDGDGAMELVVGTKRSIAVLERPEAQEP